MKKNISTQQYKKYELRSTLRGYDCSKKKIKEVCTFYRGMLLSQAKKHAESVQELKSAIPHKGLKRYLKQQISFPRNSAAGILQLFRSISGHPEYLPNENYIIHRLHYDSNSILRRIFARAQGRSSAKNRERVTVHLTIIPRIIYDQIHGKTSSADSELKTQETRIKRESEKEIEEIKE